jgi:protocatechuate 3,4-dioxygenase beta subunit
VRLHPGVEVTVEVVAAADGRPIPRARGALLLTSTLGEAGRLDAVADATGILRFPVAAFGAFQIVAEADGYAPATRSLAWLDRAGLSWRTQIALEPGVVLAGRVVDEGGAPVAGAAVSSRAPPRAQTQVPYRPRPPEPLRPAVATDADGRFRYPVPTGQGLVLVARHPRYATGETAPLVAARAAEVTITLRAGRALAGRVVDRERRPVADAQVSDGQGESGPVHVTTTDAGGRFVLRGIEPQRRQVVVHAEARAGRASPVLVALPDGFDRPLELVLDGDLRIAGSVVDGSGAPVADAIFHFQRVVADGYQPPPAQPTAVIEAATAGEARAGEDGAFVIPGLVAGDYQLLARAPVASKDRAATPIFAMVAAKAGDEQVTIALPAAARIRGRVVGADGRPVPAFDVTLHQLGGPTHVASADGRFELDGIDPGLGRCEVLVAAEGAAPHRAEARLAAGKTTDLGTIALDRGRTLRGRVVDTASGGPVAGAAIAVDGPDGKRIYTGRSDDLGRFEIPVSMDPVAVHAALTGVGGSRFELVPPERTAVDLRLPETGRVEVTVTGAAAAGDLNVTATRTDAIDGGFRIFLLARDPGAAAGFHADVSPGDYVLHAAPGRGMAALKRGDPRGDVAVTVQVGQTQRAQISLDGTLAGAAP